MLENGEAIFLIFFKLRAEFCAIKAELIRYWPNTMFGLGIRQRYYFNKMNRYIKYIGRGCLIDRVEATTIGDGVILGDNVIMAISGMSKCFIGNNVGIGEGTFLRSANHNYQDMERLIMDQGHTWKRVKFNGKEYGIVIEDDVWIGAHSIVLSGTHIGKGSVISAGSVISSFIPPYSIAVGNPARVIANRKSLVAYSTQLKKDILNE